jgi:hypothetical protein
MGEWVIQRETPPGGGSYVTATSVPQPDPADGTVSQILQYFVYQDGYANDFSEWGQDESDTIQNYLLDCSAADNGVSYAAMWIGNYPDLAGLGLRSAAASQKIVPPVVLVVLSSKTHKRPNHHGRHHGHH